MNFTSNLSIRSKLVIMLLMATIISILVVGFQGYRSAKGALNDAVFNQLTTLRAAKTQQVQAYFSDIHNQVLGFSENRTIIEALNEFRTAYRLAGRESISEAAQTTLTDYYRKEFIPRYQERMGQSLVASNFVPETGAAAYLQYHYMAANPNEVGKKEALLTAAGDEGYYAQVHERYHDQLSNLIKQFGYYDLFLIDPETGEIVYTVFKETDFATNLIDGPYASSNFARLAKEVMRKKSRGQVIFRDFDSYQPSYGSPAAFVAITVYDGKNVAGILALQIPSSKLNDVMTSNQNWEANGMGKSGEVYLVGRDHLMRSDSRFSLQQNEQYVKMLGDIGTPPEEISLIQKNNTTILFQPVHAETVGLALSGKTGAEEVVDYRGVNVMSAYAPLKVQGLDWVILSEMDIEEINQPINKFRRQVTIFASILGAFITLLALWAANSFTRPIHALVSALRRVGAGDTDVEVKVTSNDELGELTKSFNTMVGGIRQQKLAIEEMDHENELLLQNILPEPIAQRMKEGEQQIVDLVPNVSIIFTTLTGLSKNYEQESPESAISKLNHLVQEFDEAAERHGVDKLKTVGDDYMAVCGLMTPRLDHEKRALEFAREIMDIVQRLSKEFDSKLELKVGIHAGSVLAGVIGSHRFVYDVWGETVDIVNDVRNCCPVDNICVSDLIYEQLRDKEAFTIGTAIPIGHKKLRTWQLPMRDANAEHSTDV
ncbi:MAG TPA: adenylate/guanylate cyclase domain-containing protein [Gammaproteobacteria bacterium]|jgi:class 3 adenylate cyclase|nr:adenylate/guanylate cyclase domain-containing protein [Gammaproteobacteria bacterium]